jgi:hypothetical protein
MPHVTFIHGIANKPEKDALLQIWRDSLSRDDGVDLGAEGVSSSMVYWADVMYESPQADMAEHESNDSVIAKTDEDVGMGWQSELGGAEKEWADSFAHSLDFDAEPPTGDEDFQPPEEEMESIDFERIPLPWWLKRRLMKALLRDVHHYLFNTESTPREGETFRVQDEIRRRFVEALERDAPKDEPHVVVSHSMGTVIAYDCLKRVPECPQVDALMTVGSPLGIDEVQDQLKPEWSREDGFPDKVGSATWVNVYDTLDPVAGFDPKFADDYRRAGDELVRDINEQNYGKWRHNVSKYLGGSKLRAALSDQLGL